MAGGGFEPPTFGLCVPLQFSLPELSSVCSLDSPFTLSRTVRVLPIESLHLLRFRSLARDYHATGFPEFGKLSQSSFLPYSPADSTAKRLIKPAFEPDELPDCSIPRRIFHHTSLVGNPQVSEQFFFENAFRIARSPRIEDVTASPTLLRQSSV